jgi:multiple sugar transport system permease protein
VLPPAVQGLIVGTTEHALAMRSGPANWPRWPLWRRLLTPTRSDRIWAFAFAAPYVAVLLAFVVVPLIYGAQMASRPSLYARLWSDPIYLRTIVNTLIYVGLAVNLKMVLAFLLAGFFMRPKWWIKALLVIYMLPWVIATIPAFISIHWMLVSDQGFVNSFLREVAGVRGPLWLSDPQLALGSNIVAYIWKWMPFWTLVFLAARMAIPPEIYEAAAVDGASGIRRFVHVTVPLLANIYLVSTLLSVIWTLGDFTTVFLVSGGGPFHLTEVVATLANRYWFEYGEPELGVAAVVSVLPALIPIAIVLARRAHISGIQL